MKIGDLVKRKAKYDTYHLNQLGLIVDCYPPIIKRKQDGFLECSPQVKVEWVEGGWSYENPNALEVVNEGRRQSEAQGEQEVDWDCDPK